jgi:hypothetical protein
VVRARTVLAHGGYYTTANEWVYDAATCCEIGSRGAPEDALSRFVPVE